MKFYNNSLVTITTTVDGDGAEFFGYEPELRYHVRALGRGRWLVESGGHQWVLRTAQLQRCFKASDWVEEYDFDGEPVHGHQSVRVERDPWWRW